MSHFIHQREAVDLKIENYIDHVVTLQVEWSIDKVLQTVCEQTCFDFKLREPTPPVSDILTSYNSLDSTRIEKEYPVNARYNYFSVEVASQDYAVLHQLIQEYAQTNTALAETLDRINASSGHSTHPHITLAIDPSKYHSNQSTINAFLYQVYEYRWHHLPSVDYSVTHLVFNNELICFTVDLDCRIKSMNQHPHVTMGLSSDHVKARSSNNLLARAFGKTSDKTSSCIDVDFTMKSDSDIGIIEIKDKLSFSGKIVGYSK